MRKFDEQAFCEIAQAPTGHTAEWFLRAEDSLAFLRGSAGRDEIVIYASSEAVLIHGVLAPTNQVTPADQNDLLHASIDQDEGWCIQRSWSRDEGYRIYLEPPFSSPNLRVTPRRREPGLPTVVH